MKDRYQIRWLREQEGSDVKLVYGEDGNTVAYFYTGNNGKPSMLTYVRKQGKENSRYYYANEEQRQKRLEQFIEGVEYREQSKKAAEEHFRYRSPARAKKLSRQDFQGYVPRHWSE